MGEAGGARLGRFRCNHPAAATGGIGAKGKEFHPGRPRPALALGRGLGRGERLADAVDVAGANGTITAFALLIAMPELGALEAGQAANLAGLAPIARQSGRWAGRSFIRGERADVRQALYMPALVAARFNPDMKAKYAHLIETGKPAKVALIAIMRKLVVLAKAPPNPYYASP